MVKINGTTIRMTKGDTLRVMLMLEDENGFDYIPEDGDRIRFAMKESYDDAEPLLKARIYPTQHASIPGRGQTKLKNQIGWYLRKNL